MGAHSTKKNHRPLQGRLIAVNAGHNSPTEPHALKNGDGLGAWSRTGRKYRFPGNPLAITSGPWRGVIRECDLTRDLALRLRRHLRVLGARCVMTRVGPCRPTEEARNRNLRRRATVANRAGAQLLIDLHANRGRAFQRGYLLFLPCKTKKEMYVNYKPLSFALANCIQSKKFRASLRFARCLHRRLHKLRWRGKRIPPASKLPIHSSSFKVIGYVRMPAVMLEAGFMSYPKDMALLARATYRERLAGALAAAVVDFFNKEPVPQTNRQPHPEAGSG